MRHLFKRFKRSPIIRLEPSTASRGTVVISYITWPFLEGYESPKARGHTNAYECVVMAESFRKLGYAVDIIDYNNTEYVPPKTCRIAIDIHSNLERWNLPENCIRILHGTGSHWLLWNHAELTRLSKVRDRKGIALAPRRQVEPSRGVEVADHVTVLGNEYTINSFRFANKPITRIPISSAYEFPWPNNRDMEFARKRFLWVGSYGMVHKGLDLVLDAFSQLPELELTVCGRPEKEEDFYRLYERELKHLPNIHFNGWIDMDTPAFAEIARTHAAIIYPSSGEGGAGSVIHCMHAGMVPITTWEASIDLSDFGGAIRDGSVEAVKAAATQFAELSVTEVERRARNSYDHVRIEHTRECFKKNYEQFAKLTVEQLN